MSEKKMWESSPWHFLAIEEVGVGSICACLGGEHGWRDYVLPSVWKSRADQIITDHAQAARVAGLEAALRRQAIATAKAFLDDDGEAAMLFSEYMDEADFALLTPAAPPREETTT